MTTIHKPKTLSEVKPHIRAKEPFNFRDGTIYAHSWREFRKNLPIYTVYSYGEHYPMYVYDYQACQWFGNSDKSTRTTNKHMQLFQPFSVAQWVNTETLHQLAQIGLVNVIKQRME